MPTQTSPLCSGAKRYWFLSVALFLFISRAPSQISDKVSNVSVGAIQPGEPLAIQVELVKTAVVDRMEVAYR